MAYRSLIWAKPVSVVETRLFQRQAESVWTDDERVEFIDFIARNPEAGDLIKDTGGVRKVRWARQGSGKRGGARVIYFFHHSEAPIYLLMVYAKARSEDLSSDEKRAVRTLASEIKRLHPSGTKRSQG